MGHPEHFAVAVRERRLQLNLSLEGLRPLDGPTGPTVTKAEAGELVNPRPTTLAKFDSCLQWESGTAARVFWEAAEPVTLDKRRRRRDLVPSPGMVSVPRELVREFVLNRTRLVDLLPDHAGSDLQRESLESILERDKRNVSQLAGLYVTDLLEHNWIESTKPSELLEFAFGEFLAVPVGVDDPDRDDKFYRRWLMGYHDGIDEESAKRFRRRVQARRRVEDRS